MKGTVRVLALIICAALMLASCGAPTQSSSSEESSSQASVSESEVSSSAEVSSASAASSSAASFSASKQSSQANSAAANSSEVKTANPFYIGDNETYELYRFFPEQLVYGRLGGGMGGASEVVAALNALPALPAIALPSGEEAENGFLIVYPAKNYQKTQINLYKNVLEVDETAYILTQQQYDSLKKVFDAAAVAKNRIYAQWLIWMNPYRVTNIGGSDIATGTGYKIAKENIAAVAEELRGLAVSSGERIDLSTSDFTTPQQTFRIDITFDSGAIFYTLWLFGNDLYIQSSDMDYACHYKGVTADSIINTLKHGMVNPPTG